MWWTTPKKGSCEKAKQWEFALHVLKMIPEAKLQANIISYSSAISACQRLGLLCRDVMSRDLNMFLCWFCWTIYYFCCWYFNLAVRLPWCCDTLCQHVCHHGVVETTHTNRHHHHHFFCGGNSGVCVLRNMFGVIWAEKQTCRRFWCFQLQVFLRKATQWERALQLVAELPEHRLHGNAIAYNAVPKLGG